MGAFGAIAGALGWVGKVVTLVPTIVSCVEAISNLFKSGTEKKAAALAMVRQAILASEEFAGKEIIDEDAFNKFLGDTIDGIVGMMNATIWKKPAA